VIDKLSEVSEKLTVKVKPPSRSRASADAPQLSLQDYTVTVGEHLLIEAQTNCVNVKFFLMDGPGLSQLPSVTSDGTPVLNPALTKAIVVQGTVPGEYRLLAYASLNDVLTPPVIATITVEGHGPQPPPGPGPGPQPPPAPTPTPVVKSAKLFVFTIDNAEKRTAALTRVLNDPYWFALQAKGHSFAKYNTTRADVMGVCATELKANGGDGVPIIIIRDAATNKWLNKDPADLRMPADAASLKALISRYTDQVP
jgi:hypothetical protein